MDNPKHCERFIRNETLQSREVQDAHPSLISPFFCLPCAVTRTSHHFGGSGGPKAAHKPERFATQTDTDSSQGLGCRFLALLSLAGSAAPTSATLQ